MIWKTRISVRNPSFFGPFALSAGLLVAALFSEPFWQNFFLVESQSTSPFIQGTSPAFDGIGIGGQNYTTKIGSWGLCVRLTNNTAALAVGNQTSWCTSSKAGYNLNLLVNNTGPTAWPAVQSDTVLFGLLPSDGTTSVEILSSGMTSGLILHVISAVLTILTVVSLIIPPKDMPKSVESLQKSGIITIGLGFTAFILTFVTFFVQLNLALSVLKRLNKIDGISAQWGPVMWFVLPGALLMIPAFLSIFLQPGTSKSQQMELREQEELEAEESRQLKNSNFREQEEGGNYQYHGIGK